MKTTGGKTKAAKRSARTIRIVNESGGEVYKVQASSLREALLAYFYDRLQPVGWRQPVVVGNVLTTQRGRLSAITFTALEQVRS